MARRTRTTEPVATTDERDVVERLAKLAPAAVWEVARGLDVYVNQRHARGSAPTLVRDAFRDGAELVTALRTGDTSVHPVYGVGLAGLAIRLLGLLDPIAAEPLALALATGGPARAGALAALGSSSSDAALAMLVGALAGKRVELIDEAVIDALARSPHPDAAARVLAHLAERVGDPPYRAKPTARELRPAIQILGARRYAPALALLLALWKRHPDPEMADVAAEALLRFDDPRALKPLAAKWKTRGWGAREQAFVARGVAAVFALDPARAYDTFAPVLAKAHAAGDQVHAQILTILGALPARALAVDDRWRAFVEAQLTNGVFSPAALAALVATRATTSVPAILAAFDGLLLEQACGAIGELGDASTIPFLRAKARDAKRGFERRWIEDAIAQITARTSAPRDRPR